MDNPTTEKAAYPFSSERPDSVKALPPVLTIDQAAEVLNINRKTLYIAIQKREVPGVRRFGKTIRISTEALLEWMWKGRGK